jgi:hypothetical protein
MTPLITLSRALTDPALFGRTFSAPILALVDAEQSH